LGHIHIMRRAIALLALVLISAPVYAANHYVRAAADNTTGNDWTHAYTSLPTSLTRGDTYYIADGNYTSHTFSDADSSTTLITIKYATVADHGTDTGWSSGYTGSGAIVGPGSTGSCPGWNFTTDYYTVDGQTGAGAVGRVTTGYGIQFRCNGPAGNWSTGALQVSGGQHLTFKHIEIDGVTPYQADANGQSRGLQVNDATTRTSNLTLQNSYIHEVGVPIFPFIGSTWVIDHNYFARNHSTAELHAEGIAARGGTDVTISFNVWEDIEGTATIECLYENCINWKVFGNLIIGVDTTHGAVTFNVGDNLADGSYYTGLKFYNNTIYNACPSAASSLRCGVYAENPATTGIDTKNNFFYQIGYGVSLDATEDYNLVWNSYWYGGADAAAHDSWRCLTSAGADPTGNCAGNNNLIPPAATSIFTSPSTYDLTLKSNTVSGLSLIGTNLGTSYNVDINGTTRTNWSIGAYEYPQTGGSPTAVPSPTSLTFSSQQVGTTSGSQLVTLSNGGSTTLNISSIVASGDFALSTTCGSTLAAGSNCNINVTFSPTLTGTRTGSVTITDDAGDSPQSVSLSGTGTAATTNSAPAIGMFAFRRTHNESSVGGSHAR
jgi:hypothetical protein